MTSASLEQWILHPETLDRDTLYELRNLVARYPYFQTVRLLYLKNLFLLHDISFGAELRKSVLYITDRRMLFHLIEGDRYILVPQVPDKIVEPFSGKEPGLDRTLSLIDAFLATVPEEQTQSTGLDYGMDYMGYLTTEYGEIPIEKSELPTNVPKMKGQELIDGFIRMSESEDGRNRLLSINSVEEDYLSSSMNEEQSPEIENKHLEQNDSFEKRPKSELLAEKPLGEDALVNHISMEEPDKPLRVHNVPSEEMKEENETARSTNDEWDESCFTETLAKIYVKQHRYEKALEIIKKLSLNYPKKNAYFADQIRFLEKLIINAKSK